MMNGRDAKSDASKLIVVDIRQPRTGYIRETKRRKDANKYKVSGLPISSIIGLAISYIYKCSRQLYSYIHMLSAILQALLNV